jgi:hypothetical protein
MAGDAPHECQLIYLCEMMDRLGIEAGVGVLPHLSLIYATALRRCEACPSIQVCCDWLDSMPASAVVAPGFCPNADNFLELQADQPNTRTDEGRGRCLPSKLPE